jgi:hypothetical protein
MEDLRTTANLIEAFESGNPVAVLSRIELDEMFQAGAPAQLWLELGREDADDVRLLSVDLSTSDIEHMLARATGDDVLLALDGFALHGLFDDAEVEAHGFRGALAVAVVAGAIAAPAATAANPLVSTASNHVAACPGCEACGREGPGVGCVEPCREPPGLARSGREAAGLAGGVEGSRREAGRRQGPDFESTALEAAGLEGGSEGPDQQDPRHQGERPAAVDAEEPLSRSAAGPHRARS